MRRLSILVLCSAILVAAVWASQRQDANPPVKLQEAKADLGTIHPRISPDGEHIAFSYQGAIWRTPRTGGTMTRLTDGPGMDLDPAWSPDGKLIAFVRSPTMHGGDVRLIRADDGRDVPLPKPLQFRGLADYQKVEFHPDGKRLLGHFFQDGKNHGLAWYGLDTGTLTSLATLSPWGRYAMAADGSWVVYTETRDVPGQQTGNDGPQADVWKVPAAGGQREKLVRFPSRVHDLCSAGDALIAVSELGGVHYDLWRLPLTDSLRGLTKLTFGQADECRPSVSNDGRWLLYTDNRAGPTALMVRDLRSGVEQSVRFDHLDYRAPTGEVRLTVVDADTNKPVTARISLQHESGKFNYPPGALHRMLRGLGHFYLDKTETWHVPAGNYRLRAYRGPEYEVAAAEFDVRPGELNSRVITIKRWSHLAKRGWHSGENHIHANYGYGQWYNTPASMLQQCAGEDLNVCNFMVANSDTDGVFDRPFFRGGPDPLSTPETILHWNQEFRSTLWGHMTLLNLKQIVEPVFTGFKDTTNPWDIPTNSDVADRTHWQNGAVNYTHGVQNPDEPLSTPYAGKAIPLDVALGKIDTLDLNNSYAGTVPVWHRLLNCGFRIPATAGTDCFLNRIASNLPGGDRVYVHTAPGLTYANWIDGLKAGRSFVTNGPMLELSVDRFQLGDTIKLAAAKELVVRGTALSQFPLAKIELLYNGEAIATAPLPKDQKSGSIEKGVLLAKSGWIALRATGPGHPDSPLPALYAHTNPIYVEVQGKPLRSTADAVFFLRWLDGLAVMQRTRDRVPTEALKQHVQGQLDAARAVYAKIADAAGTER